MSSKAQFKNADVSPRKARLVADLVRGKRVEQALDILNYHSQKSASLIKKALESAIANAENNEGSDVDELFISEIYVDAGPTLKRIRPRAKGRADRILKRTSHITVSVKEAWEQVSYG